MDILHLVDRLEELFNNSKPIPLTRNVVVDENTFMDIIDQMRISIPDDIKKAQQIINQKERILAQAQEEANRTVALAREKSERMIEKNELYLSAQNKVAQIEENARRTALQTQIEADRYVIDTLTRLEDELNRVLIQVQNGIQSLKAEEEAAKPQETDR
jgi:hypothetical protein